MSEDPSKKVINYCVYCGAKIEDFEVYCQHCGKLIFKAEKSGLTSPIKTSRIDIVPSERTEYSRKCSGCGSTIISNVLEQCPICNAVLEKPPIRPKAEKDHSGYIFTDKKLIPEKTFVVNKETWTWPEGKKIFLSSLMIYLLIFSLLVTVLLYQATLNNTLSVETSILTIIISQLPAIAYGIYPLWYVTANKHDIKKLGLTSDRKKLVLAFVIGVLGGTALFLLNYFFSYFIATFSDFGLNFIDYDAYVVQQNTVIKNADLFWIALLVVVLFLQSFSIEIAYRGVFHNAVKKKYEKSPYGRITTILLVAFVYTLVNILISPVGILFFILDFIIFAFLGLLYEINGNLYNTIIASTFYQILAITYIFVL